MTRRQLILVTVLLSMLLFACRRETNTFRFCRDFNSDGCVNALEGKASFDLQKTIRNKSYREFYNSVYFRGDRLAFAITNADARKEVSFECLHGRYYTADRSAERFEMEYIELREKNVYGLAMLGSLIEKHVGLLSSAPYRALPPFNVTYEIFCGKDVLAKNSISVELK